jgi:hypothetical protein
VQVSGKRITWIEVVLLSLYPFPDTVKRIQESKTKKCKINCYVNFVF